MEKFLSFDEGQRGVLVSNREWTERPVSDRLPRDITLPGQPDARPGVGPARLDGDGLSYTEFSYQILRPTTTWSCKGVGCTLQVGGSDQVGNITAGADLIRGVKGAHVHGLTGKLITKADGTKFGKTAGGAIGSTRR